MAQRKAKKAGGKAKKGSAKRATARRKPARKAPKRSVARARSGGDSKRIAELEAENRRLRQELAALRAERIEAERPEPEIDVEPDDSTPAY